MGASPFPNQGALPVDQIILEILHSGHVWVITWTWSRGLPPRLLTAFPPLLSSLYFFSAIASCPLLGKSFNRKALPQSYRWPSFCSTEVLWTKARQWAVNTALRRTKLASQWVAEGGLEPQILLSLPLPPALASGMLSKHTWLERFVCSLVVVSIL